MAEQMAIRNGVIVAVVAVAAAIGGLVYFNSTRTTPPPPALPPPAAAPKPPAAPAGPQFDVLRVDAAGNTVIAGRADPGDTVTIKDGNTVLGTTIADASGSFAFIPAAPLSPGAHQLSLSETQSGGTVVAGQTSASVDVAANPNGQSLAVISGPNGSKVVSGQGPVPGTLGIGTIDYDANGHAIFSGTAHAGDHITLSLNGARIGTATAGPDGSWRLTATTPAANGTLSVADIDKPDVKPLTAPFALETLQTAVAQGHIVIAPGQNLWLIARHVYGRGTLYTLIYKANTTVIHDPNLIFPGQNFSIPKPQN
jgi:nucleoid-associated protein YgaU